MTDISHVELIALQTLNRMGGSILTTWVNETNTKGDIDEITPGIRVYKKLEKKGFVIITEEDVGDDGFEFTPMIELTEMGMDIWIQNRFMINGLK